MKKSITAILLLLCSTALAEEMTTFRHLDAKQSKTILFSVPAGTSTINVVSDTPGAIFDCDVKKEDGKFYSKHNTNSCDLVIEFDVASHIALNVTNDTTKSIDCSAHFRTLSSKKK